MLDVRRFYIPFPLIVFSSFVGKTTSLTRQTLSFLETYGANCSTYTTYEVHQLQQNASLK